MSMHRRTLLTGIAALPATAMLPLTARAQAWPSQPIKLIVTFPPGGSSDIVARLIGPPLAEKLGQPIIVDNKPGAASTIGAAAVASAKPDGYTMLMSNSAPMSISPALMDKPSYDPVRSFTHLTYIGAVPTALVVHPSLGVKDFAGFIAWAKAQKEAVAFGSGGAASVGHIVGEMLAQKAGIKMLHIPYKGAGPMRNDLLGGQLKVAIDALPQNLQFQQSGQLRLLAVTAPQRAPTAPDVPSVVELGYPSLVAENFVGISGPAGLPDDVARKFHQAAEQVLQMPDIQSKLQQLGFVLQPKSPADFTAFVRQQVTTWAPVVKQTGATI
jgi:tripartite-type tricarboxylate transporter receptor subunit TctC